MPHPAAQPFLCGIRRTRAFLRKTGSKLNSDICRAFSARSVNLSPATRVSRQSSICWLRGTLRLVRRNLVNSPISVLFVSWKPPDLLTLFIGNRCKLLRLNIQPVAHYKANEILIIENEREADNLKSAKSNSYLAENCRIRANGSPSDFGHVSCSTNCLCK